MAEDSFETAIESAAEREASAGTQSGPDQIGQLPDLSMDLGEHKIQFDVDCLQQELRELRETHDLRLEYSSRIFWLVVGWLACVIICVLFSGFSFRNFWLGNDVLIAFITSTTINVVGLFVVVAKWMFPATRGNGNHELNARKELLERIKRQI